MINLKPNGVYKKTCVYCKEEYITGCKSNQAHKSCSLAHKQYTPSKQGYIVLEFLNGLDEFISCDNAAGYLGFRRGSVWKCLAKLHYLSMVKRTGHEYRITAKGIKTLRSKENE